MRSVCVFLGSSIGARDDYREAAIALGAALAEQGLELVYGGSRVGLMGVIADSALQRGGKVHGVIPRVLVDKEVAHTGLTELEVVDSMHTRKKRMADRADAFVALPGGMGTLEELTEVLTWAQLGIHAKPCGLLNVAGYFTPWLRFLDHAVAERFLKPAHRALLIADADPQRLLHRLRTQPHGGSAGPLAGEDR
ncbi:MAG: TIGR00730 family Rossman fold protein [Pseudomonadota bacterium]|nr:TIGR00730 family Rossman fold protein [Pseudomonadota bacterium]